MVLLNKITIYHFSNQIIAQLSQFVIKYKFIQYNKSFAKLPKENQIKILLKPNQKSKIFKKIKIYLLNNRDKKLVDKIFDKLYQLSQIL